MANVDPTKLGGKKPAPDPASVIPVQTGKIRQDGILPK